MKRILLGTIPNVVNGIIVGKASIRENKLLIDQKEFNITGGTTCMIATCVQVCTYLGIPNPEVIIAQDINLGEGTRKMFEYFIDNIKNINPNLITFHYMYPILKYGEVIMKQIKNINPKPFLIADAGGMYLFKTTRHANYFDIFTPDFSELQFLSDELASHPMYVRKNFNKDYTIQEYINLAVTHSNTAQKTIVKGKTDEFYSGNIKQFETDTPNIPSMECIGGTGDTITGMLSGLCCTKIKNPEEVALMLNRECGKYINCNPATKIIEFVKEIPYVMEKYSNTIKT